MILIAMPVIGRLNMTVSICEYPYARPAGIGKAFAVFRSPHAMGHAFSGISAGSVFRMVYLFLMGAGLLTGLAVNRWIVGKIGGVTGDTYGAVTEITELVILLLYMVWSRVTVWLSRKIARLMRRVYSGIYGRIFFYGHLPRQPLFLCDERHE